MILQALVQYYEDLLANGKITRPGWTSAKVSWALELDENGQLMALHPLQQEEKRGKKTVLAPCQLQVPEQVKRSSGVAANFLCDNSAYMLGIDGKGKPERAMQCFAAAKELHTIDNESRSLSARRAWIEIQRRRNHHARPICRSPQGERG